MTPKASKWYTSRMSPKQRPYGKRVLPVPVKFSAEEKDAYAEVGAQKDRPLGYVIRELALRGLVEFRKDAKLRATDEEASAALKLSASKIKDGHSRKVS